MTRQMKDSIVYRGTRFRIIEAMGTEGERGMGVFDPSEHGIACCGISTADYRGYHCAFSLSGDNALMLDELDVTNLFDDYDYPPLNGVEAEEPELERRTVWGFDPTTFEPTQREEYTQSNGGYHRYRNVGLAIGFTGALLVGSGASDSLSRSNSIADPYYEYERALLLTFRDGRLVGERDLSRRGRWIRRMMKCLARKCKVAGR